MLENILNWDNELLIKINNAGTPVQDVIWLFITEEINWIPFFLLLILITLKFYSPKEFVRVFGFTILTFFTIAVTTYAAKYFFQRPRPLHTEELIPYLRIVTTETGYSFFSGHTSNSFAICTFLYLVFRQRLKWAFWIFIWAVPYAFSRLYLAVHFPTDVLVGMIVGISSALFWFYFYQIRFDEKFINLDKYIKKSSN